MASNIQKLHELNTFLNESQRIPLHLEVTAIDSLQDCTGLSVYSMSHYSVAASLLPKLGWKTFFDEPVMLLAFVLLGRSIEERAKLKASADMTAIMSLVPDTARLLVDQNTRESSGFIVNYSRHA